MRNNSELRNFRFGNNPIGNAFPLVDAINSHPTIGLPEKEDLSKIYLMYSLRVAAQCPKSISLALLGNLVIPKPVDVEDVVRGLFLWWKEAVLPDFLSTNPTLRNLHLDNNNLNDSDATLIAADVPIPVSFLC